MATKEELARENGRKGLEAVHAFMERAKWKHEVIQEIPEYVAYRVSFKDDFPVVGCMLETYIDQQQFISYLLFRPVVPADKRAAMAEFITRANFGMKIGNFEMSWDEGEVRYKSSIDFQQIELSRLLVHNAIMAALDSVEPYAAAFLSVVQEGTSPAVAVKEAEGG